MKNKKNFNNANGKNAFFSVENISQRSIGKTLSMRGIIDSVFQTEGPTLFTLDDGTGNLTLQAFLEAGKRANRYIRNTGKPMFLECLTYRYKQHVGINNDDRKFKEVIKKKKKDQLYKLKKMINNKEERELAENVIINKINEVFNNADKEKFPIKTSLYLKAMTYKRNI